MSDDINIGTDNFDNGVYWITPSTLGNPSGSYGRLVKMDNYKMFASAIATSGIYYTRELWVSIYVNSTWTPFNGFSDDATLFFGTIINRGDDLNDFITPGRYYCADSSFIGQISNIPENFGSGFTMAVYRTIGENVIQVIFRSNQSSAIYTRAKITAGWQSWYKYTGTVISS